MRARVSSAKVMLLLLCVAFFAGCSAGRIPPEAPADLPVTTASLPAAPLPRGPSGILRWSLEGIRDLETIDPARPGNNASISVIGLIFGGLVRLNQHLEVQNEAAASWQVSQDRKTYTFTLRDKLKFADGTPVTAHDFVYSINRALAPETKSYGVSTQLSQIVGANDVLEGRAREASGVRALNDRTLEIQLERPQAYFPAQLSAPYTFVVPRSLVESGDDWQERAYGIGPFRVKEWVHGERLILTANEHYWRGKPGFDELHVWFHPQSSEAYERYRRGELDIMGSQQNPLPADLVSEVEQSPNFHSVSSLTTRYVGFNHLRAPFANLHVRRAFALAVDKEKLSREVLGNTVVPAERILPDGLMGDNLPTRPLGFDPAAAQAELAQAGYPDGAGFPAVALAYATEGDTELVARALQSFWRQNLGVEVKLEPHDLPQFIDLLDRTYYTPREGLQVYLSVWGADYPDPHNFISQQLRSGVPHNNGHFSNPDFDRLVDEADRLAGPDDIDRRLQLYNQAEQIAIDQVGWLPLYYPLFNTLLRSDIEGMMVTPIGIVVPDWTKVRRK